MAKTWADSATPTLDQIQILHGKLDKNSDGKLSVSEAVRASHMIKKSALSQVFEVKFQELDTDKDMRLDMAEVFKTFPAPDEEEVLGNPKSKSRRIRELEAKKFKTADLDGDRSLNVTEASAYLTPELHMHVLEVAAQHKLETLDKDGDGMLTRSEFWDHGHDLSTRSVTRQDFFLLDEDRDGKLSHSEFMAWESGHYNIRSHVEQIFEVADQDRDEHLTTDELTSAQDHIAATRAHGHMQGWLLHYHRAEL